MSASEHDEFDLAAAAYALGTLDAAERVAFEWHLASCARCQAALADFDRVNGAIALGTEPVEPPASLRARTLARATAGARAPVAPQVTAIAYDGPARARHAQVTGPGRWSWLAAAAAIVAVVGLGSYAWSLRSQVTTLRQMVFSASAEAEALRGELASARRESARLTNTVGVLGAPDLLRVDLRGASTAPRAIGRAFVSRAHGLVFAADGLPSLPPGHVYQLWLIPNAAGPVSAGVFAVDPAGSSNVSLRLPGVFASTPVKTIAVTVEPGPNGSPGPTSAILLAGSVGG